MKEKIATNPNQVEKFCIENFRKMTVDMIEEMVRKSAIEYVNKIMQEEVESLCGKRFQHKKGKLAHRAGNETGSILLNGQRSKIKRPRVRKGNEELPLETYTKLHNMDNITDIVLKMMISGISTRSYEDVLQKFENDLGVSKSTVSRQFIKKSREYLNDFNTRKFPEKTFWGLMIDGIAIGGDVVIVILGIDTEGNKHFLGISQGSTENSVIVEECLNRLTGRQIQFTDHVVVVLDGSQALRKAVITHFGDRVEIQRCLIHKMRNVVSANLSHSVA